MQGQKVTIQNGRLNVPYDPMIPFYEGDVTGPHIWAASLRVFEAAAAKLKCSEFGTEIINNM
jgi:isocitrate dehydrogenase